MAVVSLFTNGEAIALDATSDVNYSRTASVSTATIFQGANISDNYRPDLATISLQGVVTATKTRTNESGLLSPSAFRALLNTWMDNKYLIKLYGTYDNAIPNMANLVISDFNLNRSGIRSDGLSVSLTLKQIDISTSVKKSSITLVPKDNTQGLTTKPSDNTPQGKTTENSKEMDKTVLKQITDLDVELEDL